MREGVAKRTNGSTGMTVFAPARPGLITRAEKSDTFTDLLGHLN